MLLCWLLFLAAFQLSSAQFEAECTMRLHNDGTEIGKVIFKSDGHYQRVQANLEGDPEIITEGWHGFHVHSNPVQGNDCGPDSTGGHFNPDGSNHGKVTSHLGERHVGDFGNVRAGERGEINFDMRVTVDPWKPEGGNMLIEPVYRCAPYLAKVWSDGRQEPLLDIQERRSYAKGYGRKKGRRRRKKCTKRKQRKGLCTVEPTFTIKEVTPDCYVPKSNTYNWTLNSPKFTLHGYQSIVGRAVVLHAGRDDLGRGVGEAREGSLKTGNAGSRIACCTLVLAEGHTN